MASVASVTVRKIRQEGESENTQDRAEDRQHWLGGCQESDPQNRQTPPSKEPGSRGASQRAELGAGQAYLVCTA